MWQDSDSGEWWVGADDFDPDEAYVYDSFEQAKAAAEEEARAELAIVGEQETIARLIAERLTWRSDRPDALDCYAGAERLGSIRRSDRGWLVGSDETGPPRLSEAVGQLEARAGRVLAGKEAVQ